MHASDPSTEDAEAEGLKVRGQPTLCCQFKDSLGNLVKPFIKEGKKGRREERRDG